MSREARMRYIVSPGQKVRQRHVCLRVRCLELAMFFLESVSPNNSFQLDVCCPARFWVFIRELSVCKAVSILLVPCGTGAMEPGI